MAQQHDRLSEAYRGLRQGTVTRREFMARAAALGMSAPATLLLVNSVSVDVVAAQNTPFERPGFGTEGQSRGAGGDLRVLQWLGLGVDAPTLVQEPLLAYAPDGSLLPNLVVTVPSLENGGLSADLRTVTFELLEDLAWSDGEPVTPDDVVWTWQWVLDETNQASDFLGYWKRVEAIEPISATRFQAILTEGALAWFLPFTGYLNGPISPKHLWDGQDKAVVNRMFSTDPIGTGAYKIDSFIENDQVRFSINEHYREPEKPFFATVVIKAGGDQNTAAQAVLQDGDWDMALNIQTGAELLRGLEAHGKGIVATSGFVNTEQLVFNFSDPNVEIDGERSSLGAPHPFLTDFNVRKAMALAIDREAVTSSYLGSKVGVNILTGIGSVESPNTKVEFNIDLANQILDDAGWVREGDLRSKDGIELEVRFNTSNSAPRPEIARVVQQGWEAIGIRVNVGLLDPQVFFAPDARNSEGALFRFPCDVEMYTNGPGIPFPLEYMSWWYAGINNENVAQQSNGWQADNIYYGAHFRHPNIQRYVNPAYDALFESAESTNNPTRAAELFIAMNDIVVNEFVAIPLVTRPFHSNAISNRLVHENVAAQAWDSVYWNIANWRTVEG
jgi:peptide/nickel transport system substrate-binding protein